MGKKIFIVLLIVLSLNLISASDGVSMSSSSSNNYGVVTFGKTTAIDNATLNVNNSALWSGHPFSFGEVSSIESDPIWTANSTLVPYLANDNTFTGTNTFNSNIFLSDSSNIIKNTYSDAYGFPIKDITINTSKLSTSILLHNFNTSTSTTTEGAPYFFPPRSSALILRNNNTAWAFSLFGNDGTAVLRDSFRIYNPDYNKAPVSFEVPSSYPDYTAIYIDKTAQVGMGTTNPLAKVHINSEYDGRDTEITELVAGSSHPTIKVQNTGSTNRLILRSDVPANGVRIESQDNSDIVFHTQGGTYDSNEVFRVSNKHKSILFTSDNYGVRWGTASGNVNDSAIYWDGTNLVFITNSSSPYTGNAWFSRNISATGYITRTSVYDLSKGSALNYVKDSSQYKTGDEINHSAFYGYATYPVTDYSRPVNIIKEFCNDELGDGKIICKNITEVTYPYQKMEEGVILDKEIDVLRQAVYEQQQTINSLNSKINKLCALAPKGTC